MLGPLAIDLGGVVGSLGKQDTATVFAQQPTRARTAPIICYESIYGSWVGQFAQSGAQFISIITNDAWWGNTPGHVQHYYYAKLRAIEQRQWVARSANTGISGFINNRGDDVGTRTQYAVPAALKQKVGLSTGTTAYASLGDALGYAAVAATLLLLVLSRIMGSNKVQRMGNEKTALPN
jgi:apolipoprotein N-acyltransferase